MSRRAESQSSKRGRPTAPRPAPAPAAREAAPQPPLPAWTSALVGALFGALYLVLAPPVTGPKDAAEFTVVLALNGAAHPTGYPLYVMLGHLFVTALHAMGASWAYAANAWSAAGGGVAIALLHALALRLIPARAPAPRLARFALATFAAGVFALNPIWLLDAILAEVYTWHLAWVSAVSLFALAAIRALAAREVAPARVTRGALAWGFLSGLGLAHHLTAVVVIAPLTLALLVALVRARRWNVALVPLAAVAALPPLAAYGFIAWRAFHPARFQWELLEPTWAGVFAHIRGAAYGDLLGHFAPDAVQAGLLRTYCWPVLVPALALAAVAVFRGGAHSKSGSGAERLARGAFFAAALLQTLYAFEYGVRDPSCYFEPAMALALLGVAVLGADLIGPRGGAARVALPAALVLLAVLGAVWLPLAASIRSGTIETDRRMRALWRSIPPGPGFVLWDHDMVATFALYQKLEGQRPDLFAGSPAALSWRGPRRTFRKEYGFDPLTGLEPLNAERAARIPENIARQTPLPVRVFDLENQRLVEVPKP